MAVLALFRKKKKENETSKAKNNNLILYQTVKCIFRTKLIKNPKVPEETTTTDHGGMSILL